MPKIVVESDLCVISHKGASMKHVFGFLLTASYLCAMAQNQPPPRGDGVPVTSHNKTLFSSLSAPIKPSGGGGSPTSAITVIDGTGKTLGRWYHNPFPYNQISVLMPYNGQFMVASLTAEYRNGKPTGSLDWGFSSSSTNYASTDCSGTAYVSGYGYLGGTTYLGMSIADASGSFMLIVDTRTIATIGVASTYYYNGTTWQCYAYPQAGQSDVYPIMGTAPLANFGVSPMTLK